MVRDVFGRNIEYMRVSVTDRCNLRCNYCMPEGIQCIPMKDILTFEEIVEICSVAASLGIKYIRLTGGEPLARRGCARLVKMLKDIDGIEKVTMTTNGIDLGENLYELMRAGLDGVNISLDTLDKKKYQEITGFDLLDNVIQSINSAYEIGLNVKINTVILNENISDWQSIIALSKDRKIDVRFIEMMPIGMGRNFVSVSCNEVVEQMKANFPDIVPTDEKGGLGPATYYKIPSFKGKIGFINAVHDKFCDSCNRVRLSSTGFLKTCLCYDEGIDLRTIIRCDKTLLKTEMEKSIYNKPKEHCFDKIDLVTEKNKMSEIGG